MASQFQHFIAKPTPCAYLPQQTSSLEYRLMNGVSGEELDHLLARGWRRFGVAYFRPSCVGCSECVPLRIPVNAFAMSRQQKRAFKRCQRFRLVVGPPQVDEERLALYQAWHAMQGAARGWSPEAITCEEYQQQFAMAHPCAREFAYYDDQPQGEVNSGAKLICVSLVDQTPRALSAVYTYHHPAYRKLSLGTASILFQLRSAALLEKKWVYLGYRVLGCKSSAYKANFRPHELLVGRPEFDQVPLWRSNDVL